jgi:hypothetical protein
MPTPVTGSIRSASASATCCSKRSQGRAALHEYEAALKENPDRYRGL